MHRLTGSSLLQVMACCLFWHQAISWTNAGLLYPPHNEVVVGGGGYIGFTSSVHPSVRPSVRPPVRPSVLPAFHVRSVAPTVLVGSISYLYILSHVKFIAKFRNLNFLQFFKFCNFDFVLFLLWIWYDSQVWVIMGRWGEGYLRTQAF